MKLIHTQTYIFNIHDTQVTQTPDQRHHMACNQVILWSIRCILDMESNPHFRKTTENRRETNRIVY